MKWDPSDFGEHACRWRVRSSQIEREMYSLAVYNTDFIVLRFFHDRIFSNERNGFAIAKCHLDAWWLELFNTFDCFHPSMILDGQTQSLI